MPAAKGSRSSLSTDDQRVLAALLADFQNAWQEGSLAEGHRTLRKLAEPLRRAALLGMVAIDLRQWWQRGRRVMVEDYLRDVPELGTLDTIPLELIRSELEVRRSCGEPADAAEIARRFPGRARELSPGGREPIGSSGTKPAETKPTRELPAPPTRETAALLPQTLSTRAAPPGTLPEQFGRYHIVRCLGQGGMGSVYLARDPAFDRQVALKVPNFTASDGPHFIERFYREARAAAALRHPNFCPVYDVGEVDGVHFLTMAYIEGKSLDRVLADDGPLPPPRAVALVRTLALALHEAHERGVIHRDLKPSNIVIDAGGEPVILDFGLARRGGPDDARLTRDGSMMGTPAYMPPEQVTGDVQAMGPGCDIYSLGVILYELLTGRLPFEGPTAGVFAQILSVEPPRPSRLRPGLDARLDAVCLRAMAKKIENRFPDMRAMAEALAGHADKRKRPPPRAPATSGARKPATAPPAAAALRTMPRATRSTVEARDAPDVTAPMRSSGPVSQDREPWPIWVTTVGGMAALATLAVVVLFLTTKTEKPTRNPATRVATNELATVSSPSESPYETAAKPAELKPDPPPPQSRAKNDAARHDTAPPRATAAPQSETSVAAAQPVSEDRLTPEAANMIKALADKDAEVRQTVASAMGKLRPPHAAVVAALCQALRDRDARVRRSAAYALCELNDKAAVGALIERIADDNWGATWGRPGAPPFGAFLDVYDDVDTGVNQGSKPAALASLQFLDSTRVDEALDKAAKSDNAAVRTWAAQRAAERRRAREAATGPSDKKSVKADGDGDVQGVWLVRSAELDGQRLELSKQRFTVRIDSAAIVWSLPLDDWVPVGYRLGIAGDLRSIDTVPLTKPNGLVSQGIYRCDGETLTLCFPAEPQLPRPTSFTSHQCVLFALERFKP